MSIDVEFKKLSVLPRIYPDEHLLSAINRATYQRLIKSHQELLAPGTIDHVDWEPNIPLRPLYKAFANHYSHLHRDHLMQMHTTWSYFSSFTNYNDHEPPCDEAWDLLTNNRGLLVPTKRQHKHIDKKWRWCAECAKFDESKYGLCYWHTTHQIPGIGYCLKHPSSPLLGACSDCWNIIPKLTPKIKISSEGHCPICRINNVEPQHPPKHDVVNFIHEVSTKLFHRTHKFDWEAAKQAIIKAIGYKTKRFHARAHGNITVGFSFGYFRSLPPEAYNWLFSSFEEKFDKRRLFPNCDIVILYSDEFLHPVTALCFSWMFLSNEEIYSNILIPIDKSKHHENRKCSSI